jgi:tetratricopeptide (TPR) repeat protein
MYPSVQKIRATVISLVWLLAMAMLAPAQTKTGVVEGFVRDARKQPVAGAKVWLDDQVEGRTQFSTTDAAGHFRFADLQGSAFMVRVQKTGFRDASQGPIALKPGETQSVNLQLNDEQASAPASGKSDAQTMEYSDEPKFTVAGVSDPSDVGGHGSNVTLPTKEALAKDTASLGRENAASLKTSDLKRAEDLLRRVPPEKQTADDHALLADTLEGEGKSVEAVKEWQRAAEMAPTEAHLFSWGAELLLHHAYEPAAEVFASGHQRYPQSIPLLVGMGAAAYARDLHEQAAHWLLEAIAIDPADARPYEFLNKVQEIAKSEPREWAEAFRRFAALQPENAKAHYYYAVALEKQRRGESDFAEREAHLNRALALDPEFGGAYLRQGLLQAEQKNYAKAVASLRKAVEYTPLPDEAHLRLAQVYREMGEQEKARAESQLYSEVSEKKKQQLERERRELGQFVYTMPKPATKP